MWKLFIIIVILIGIQEHLKIIANPYSTANLTIAIFALCKIEVFRNEVPTSLPNCLILLLFLSIQQFKFSNYQSVTLLELESLMVKKIGNDTTLRTNRQPSRLNFEKLYLLNLLIFVSSEK